MLCKSFVEQAKLKWLLPEACLGQTKQGDEFHLVGIAPNGRD